MSLRIALLPLFAMGFSAFGQPGVATLNSPDGRITLTFETVAKKQPGPRSQQATPAAQVAAEGGQLVYLVSFQGKSLLEPSALRLDLKGQPPLGQDMKILSATPSQSDSTYQLITGKASTVRDHYNALRVELEETAAPGRKLVMEARAYNDGVAFRYLVPKQPALTGFNLTKEGTEFRFSKDPLVYALELPNYRSGYESEYVKLSASALTNQGGVRSSILVGLPLLAEVPGVGWTTIMEADLRGYSAMYLTNPSGSWMEHWFTSMLAPQVENPEMAVTGDLPRYSPWRVLMVADNPARFIESNILTSLNPECALKDTSWIRPGRAAWDWWNGSLDAAGKRAFTTGNMKYYVDFAASAGLEYMLVDAGWSAQGDITKMNGRVDIPELVKYAASKNVKVWIWVGSSQLMKQMDAAYPIYEQWGVAGIKTDFVLRDDQVGTEFYFEAAEKAARHHLMIDFHGCTKPSGIQRTYPNIMGYESVLGMEQSTAGYRDNPENRVTLPFTRMVAGPMDYTPGGFNNVTRDEFVAQRNKPMVMGTRAHHLAMYVVYESPFQMVADWPEHYRNQPAFEFIKGAPATWDETRVLNGEVGEYITIARRHGRTWFLGSMTNWDPRELEIELGFLGQGHYTAEIYADTPDSGRSPKLVAISKRQVDRNGRLKASLVTAGGYAVRFVPVNP
jgi:alpha-glucosidase